MNSMSTMRLVYNFDISPMPDVHSVADRSSYRVEAEAAFR